LRRLALIVLALAAFTGAASGAPQPPGPLTAFVVAGGGWGHGVGMSQWGAYGQAKAGRSYQQILGYYYRGTELGNAPASLLEKVRVLVRGDLGSVSVSSSAPIVVIDAGGKRYRLDATLTVEPKLELPVGKAGAVVPLTGPLTLRPAADANLVFGGKAYRGELQLTKIDGRLQLVNALGLEAYLLGVVPGEMPKHWPLEALKAQAVAARTYAVAHLAKGKSYDLFSDYRSQLYYGVGARRRARPRRCGRHAGRSSRTRAGPRRRCTSRRAAGTRSARSTPSAGTSRTSSPSTIPGTRRRRITPGRHSS